MAAPRRRTEPPPVPLATPSADRLLAIVRLQAAVAATPLSPAALVQLVTTRTVELTNACGAAVVLRDDVVLRRAASAGTLAAAGDVAIPLAGSLEGLCLHARRTLHAADTATDDRVDRLASRRAGAAAMACAPILQGPAAAGVLSITADRARHFTAEDVSTLTLLAEITGAALTSAERLAAACGALERDLPTGLGDRRAFDAALAREIDRHRRYRVPLSMTLVGLDRLAIVRDLLGGEPADAVLRDAAAIVLLELRTCDAAFRVAEDQLAILWADTGLAGAEIASARVVRHLRDAGLGRGAVIARHGVVELRDDEAPWFCARAMAALEHARAQPVPGPRAPGARARP
jgi:GGDEF domain-containing protein